MKPHAWRAVLLQGFGTTNRKNKQNKNNKKNHWLTLMLVKQLILLLPSSDGKLKHRGGESLQWLYHAYEIHNCYQ